MVLECIQKASRRLLEGSLKAFKRLSQRFYKASRTASKEAAKKATRKAAKKAFRKDH